MFVYRMVPSEDRSAYSPSSEALLLRPPYLFSQCVQFHLEILNLVSGGLGIICLFPVDLQTGQLSDWAARPFDRAYRVRSVLPGVSWMH